LASINISEFIAMKEAITLYYISLRIIHHNVVRQLPKFSQMGIKTKIANKSLPVDDVKEARSSQLHLTQL